MRLSEANMIVRRAIIKEYFIPEMVKLGYEKGCRHPSKGCEGLLKECIHIFFDIETGSDYSDGDEWFIVEYVLHFDGDLPDDLKSPEYFTRASYEDGFYWRHRELVRYRRGKAKRLDEALMYIDRKARELIRELEERSIKERAGRLDGPG